MHNQLQISKLLNQTSIQIENFVERVKSQYGFQASQIDSDDRRVDERFQLTMPVRVTQLDDQLEPRGFAKKGVTRDISYNGVGLALSGCVNGKFLLVEFGTNEDESFKTISTLAYCIRDGGFYRVGCEFLVCETGFM